MNYSFPHAMERIHPKYTAITAIFVETGACGIGIMLVSVIGYFFNTWVAYYYVLGVFVLMSLPIVAFMPRSFRWYFSQK